jgi:hypothetical protein
LALVQGKTVWRRDEAGWTEIARLDAEVGTCLLPTPSGLLVGTADAHLHRLAGGALIRLESFDRAPGRAEWYTPWGDPPDTRSLSTDPVGALYVNVHVGGVVRSSDGGLTWQPTLDIEADVHQVLAPAAGVVLVASAQGFGQSRDGGGSWAFDASGLHGRYLRAVAVAGDTVLVTASTGPRTRRGAVYRRRLGPSVPWTRCRAGLPEWFQGNVDTHCLAAGDGVAAVGTADGQLFVSADRGRRWALAAKGLPAVRCVAIE